MRSCRALCIAAGLVLFDFTGCNNRQQRRSVTLSPQELEVARHAISVRDVSLMLRAGSSQREIVSEIQRRHVASALDSSTEAQLRGSGARAELIAALKDNANILTAEEQTAYANFTTRTQNIADLDEAPRPDRPSALFSVNEPLADNRSQPRAVKTVQQNNQTYEDRVAANERIQANYLAQKQTLENKIAAQQVYIERLRYRQDEATMLTATQQLEDYKQQLANLSPPELR